MEFSHSFHCFIPSAGGYVLDNFPRTREQFTSMIERNIIPDEVIYLRDDSENGELLLKRWYQTNKEGELIVFLRTTNKYQLFCRFFSFRA